MGSAAMLGILADRRSSDRRIKARSTFCTDAQPFEFMYGSESRLPVSFYQTAAHVQLCGNSNDIVNKNIAGLEDQEPRQVKNQSARGIKLRIFMATGRQLSSFGLVHPNTQNQGSYAKAVCKSIQCL